MLAIPVLLLLFLLGGAAALVVLGGLAIATKRWWIVPAGLGLMVMALMACGLLGGLYVAVRSNSHVSPAVATEVYNAPLPGSMQYLDGAMSHSVLQAPPNFNVSASGPQWSKLLIVVILIAFIIGLVVRRGMSPATAHFFRRGWAAIPLVILFGLFFVRSSSRTYTVSEPNRVIDSPAPRLPWEVENANEHYVAAMNEKRPPAEIANARQQYLDALTKHFGENSRMQQKHLEETRRAQQKHLQDTLTAQQKHVEATMLAQQKRVAELDIHAEMEQFDAPRILLSPEAPEPQPALAAPSVSAKPTAVAKSADKPASATKSSVRPKKGDAKKLSASTGRKDRPQTESNDNQSKATIDSSAKKRATAPAEPAMVAEAESDKSQTRPAWVDEAPKRTGSVSREVIATDLYESIDECYQAADVYLLLKTYHRIQVLTGQPYTDLRLPSLSFKNGQIVADGQLIGFGRGNTAWNDYRFYLLGRMGINVDFVRREIVAKDPKNNESREFIQTDLRSFGPMKKLYLQIEFTPAIDRDLRRLWEASQRQERFAMFGVGAGSFLSLLGFVFAILKIDTATKGYYTKRLFIGVPLAILGMFGLFAMLVEMGFKLPH